MNQGTDEATAVLLSDHPRPSTEQIRKSFRFDEHEARAYLAVVYPRTPRSEIAPDRSLEDRSKLLADCARIDLFD